MALASLENPQKRAATGEKRGMMLVRGDNVFFRGIWRPGQTPPDPFVNFEASAGSARGVWPRRTPLDA